MGRKVCAGKRMQTSREYSTQIQLNRWVSRMGRLLGVAEQLMWEEIFQIKGKTQASKVREGRLSRPTTGQTSVKSKKLKPKRKKKH